MSPSIARGAGSRLKDVRKWEVAGVQRSEIVAAIHGQPLSRKTRTRPVPTPEAVLGNVFKIDLPPFLFLRWETGLGGKSLVCILNKRAPWTTR